MKREDIADLDLNLSRCAGWGGKVEEQVKQGQTNQLKKRKEKESVQPLWHRGVRSA